jgi:hypothetical protein
MARGEKLWPFHERLGTLFVRLGTKANPPREKPSKLESAQEKSAKGVIASEG